MIPGKAALRRALLAWYDAEKRALPWRETRDPYAIFVSELMLQQTRVETVIPYFARFMQRFPTFEGLAAADVDDVLSTWSGLGYYRRARNMHLCAKEVVARHAGAFPRTRAEAERLPGIGPYTAGAVLSIAFDRPEALVDGNVARVLSRVFAIDAPLASRESNTTLWETARALCEGDRPGDFNQALMELGATVCAPRSPRCGACPLAKACRARAEGREAELPKVTPKRKVPEVTCTSVVVVHRGKVLMGKRPEQGLFAGLWEPPVREGTPDDVLAAHRRDGMILEGPRAAGRVTHVLTHKRLLIDVIVASVPEVPSRLTGYDALAFVDADAPGRSALSTLARKIVARGLSSGTPDAAPPRSRGRKAR